MLELIDEQIKKDKSMNLEPRVVILGSFHFDALHKTAIGYTPFSKQMQIRGYKGLDLIEDEKNTKRLKYYLQ